MSDQFFKKRVIVKVDEEEASRMRETWFQHIFNNIEKLSADLYSSKEALTNKLNQAREEHYHLKENSRTYTDAAIKELKKELKEEFNTIQVSIKALNDSLKEIRASLSAHEMKRLDEARRNAESIEKKFSALKDNVDKKITPVSQEVWTSKGKLAVWATILGLIAAAIVTFIVRRMS
jgi:predicted unusual protein kinase regulating ubiquinone biosynthesis (AarF/ABC1/UbiB family)